jgi:hypothetical protein
VAKLAALDIRFDQLVADGVVANYAELARLGRVTRARLAQIMNLLNLAPKHGRQPVTEPQLRAISAVAPAAPCGIMPADSPTQLRARV